MPLHPARLLALRTLLAVASAGLLGGLGLPETRAQGVVSAGINGTILDPAGNPAVGVAISLVHEPTGATLSAVSRADGRYSFRGLQPGGPFTLNARAASAEGSQTGVVTQLGQEIDVTIRLTSAAGEIVRMAAYTVGAGRGDLDAGATGAGTLLSGSQLAQQPTVQRSFADMARASSLVTLRHIQPPRSDAQITAVGQNVRFNSIQLDGARINDQYGLNTSGLQSFANPISLETIEQMSIAVSPYDVRQSGFTGASINAVTRSGTNRFGGSIYAYYTDQDLQGENRAGPTAGVRPTLKQVTYGLTFGGPILRNRLFFFVNYERFTSDTVASQPGFVPDADALASITSRLTAINAAAPFRTDFGTYGSSGANRQEDSKRLVKLDWQIVPGHRLSIRYNETEGELPQFGRFSLSAPFTGVAPVNLTAPVGTALSSNFFAQTRREKVLAGQLFNNWSESLKSEFHFAHTSYAQETPVASVFPEVRIFGVPGSGPSGRVANGVLVLGTEQGRQGNALGSDTTSYKATADYFRGPVTFTVGADREESNFSNLFRSGSYGLFDYATPAAFQADTVAAFSRSLYVRGTPGAEETRFSVTGLFLQARYEATSRLTLNAGLRADLVDSPGRPLLNAPFVTAFGLRNDGTVDGTSVIAPRLSFNYALNESRVTQVRGGLGLFQGRAPWVFINNAFGNTGVGRFAVTTPPSSGLGGYLRTGFDPAAPIGVAEADIAGRRVINLLEEKLRVPSVWRGNLALDARLPVLGSRLSVEFVHTRNAEALFSDNLNIRPLVVTAASGPAVGADGRQRFNGSAAGAGAVNTGFGNVIRLRNVGAGESSYVTLGWDRPMRDRWSASLAYTRGRSTEAQSFGHTVAADGWTNNAIFNQNTVEVARSDFEIRDRLQATLAREFEFAKAWKTVTSLYYEGRSGNPYSWTYSGDLNGDGVLGNDLIYVPTDAGDARVDFSGLSAVQQAAYLDFIDQSPLAAYRGRVVPRNAFLQPWTNRLDLRIAQTIPLWKALQVEVFADFVNFGSLLSRKLFGYYEKLGDFNGVYARRFLGDATYTSAGRIRPTFPSTPASATIDNDLSRWRMQFGARVKF